MIHLKKIPYFNTLHIFEKWTQSSGTPNIFKLEKLHPN